MTPYDDNIHDLFPPEPFEPPEPPEPYDEPPTYAAGSHGPSAYGPSAYGASSYGWDMYGDRDRKPGPWWSPAEPRAWSGPPATG